MNGKTIMSLKGLTIGFASLLALTACEVAPPTGPKVMALPGAGKDFGQFQQEDMICRQYASGAIGNGAGAQAGTDRAVGTALAGTALGAGVGAALGSLSGQMGAGAAVGGAMGALVGTSAGANSAARSGSSLQQQYDIAYTQCMYGHGDSVQNPPGGYRSGYGGGGYPVYGAPYPYYGWGGPAIVVGGGWGWRHWR
jgi:hypothetical protein